MPFVKMRIQCLEETLSKCILGKCVGTTCKTIPPSAPHCNNIRNKHAHTDTHYGKIKYHWRPRKMLEKQIFLSGAGESLLSSDANALMCNTKHTQRLKKKSDSMF